MKGGVVDVVELHSIATITVMGVTQGGQRGMQAATRTRPTSWHETYL